MDFDCFEDILFLEIDVTPVTLCTKSLNECHVHSALINAEFLPFVKESDDFYRNHLRTFYAISVCFSSVYDSNLMQ